MAEIHSTSPADLATELSYAVNRVRGVLKVLTQSSGGGLDKATLQEALFGLEVLVEDARASAARLCEAVAGERQFVVYADGDSQPLLEPTRDEASAKRVLRQVFANGETAVWFEGRILRPPAQH